MVYVILVYPVKGILLESETSESGFWNAPDIVFCRTQARVKGQPVTQRGGHAGGRGGGSGGGRDGGYDGDNGGGRCRENSGEQGVRRGGRNVSEASVFVVGFEILAQVCADTNIDLVFDIVSASNS